MHGNLDGHFALAPQRHVAAGTEASLVLRIVVEKLVALAVNDRRTHDHRVGEFLFHRLLA